MNNFEGLANQHGLVPMRFVAGWYTPYREGDIAGFPPDVAARLFGEDQVAVPLDGRGEPVPIAPPSPAGETPPLAIIEADIPSDWESMHHLQRIRLAREIAGDGVGSLTSERADSIIRAEAQRRKEQANGHEV